MEEQQQLLPPIDRLSDDELAQILLKIVSRVDRKACAQVSRRWLRLEGSTRTSLRILDPQLLPDFLPRFRSLLSLEAGRGLCDPDLALIARLCPHLQSLNLNISKSRDLIDLNFSEEYEYDAIGDQGVSAIAAGCKDLRRVTLRWRQGVGDVGVSALLKSCENLTYLDLSRCKRLTDQALEAMAGANSLQVAILKGCTLVTDWGLNVLASGRTARTLRRLDLSECDQLMDNGVASLHRMSALQILYLAECGPRITDIGGVGVALVTTLQSLNLSWLINVSDLSILTIADNCADLRELILSGCELVTGLGIRGFSRHKALQALTLTACYNIYSDDVEDTAINCTTLEYLGLDRGLRRWIPAASLDSIQSRCRIEWL